jgi:hypothetical protein
MLVINNGNNPMLATIKTADDTITSTNVKPSTLFAYPMTRPLLVKCISTINYIKTYGPRRR